MAATSPDTQLAAPAVPERALPWFGVIVGSVILDERSGPARRKLGPFAGSDGYAPYR